MGGGGLFNPVADSIMTVFQKAIQTHPEIMDHDLVFDIGASAFDPQVFMNIGDYARGEAVNESNLKLAETI